MAEFQRPESGVGQSRRGVSEKRPRGSLTGITPLQKGKRPAVLQYSPKILDTGLASVHNRGGACLSPVRQTCGVS